MRWHSASCVTARHKPDSNGGKVPPRGDFSPWIDGLTTEQDNDVSVKSKPLDWFPKSPFWHSTECTEKVKVFGSYHGIIIIISPESAWIQSTPQTGLNV